ncbi:hypothetical protein M409DRAFT_21249 [Zasmidium cellare ATCC 36951]|uniref:Uncharacterized protein n=1 Tax=Zasmidium cellare ATCC 36951 TaxID=1080233 RepID=A0A6A6CQU0_ZASCE|nr:uncharacterized protein M409DRAFT_21249 [Zasmidium cellare ATCC 36951]KAF2168500.1 hypothetical protein M409DRAFT_21249 [Zasmidium cellare ATCC 36951]
MKPLTTFLLALFSTSCLGTPTGETNQLITSECLLNVPNGLQLCVDKKTTTGNMLHGWPCDQAKKTARNSHVSFTAQTAPSKYDLSGSSPSAAIPQQQRSLAHEASKRLPTIGERDEMMEKILIMLISVLPSDVGSTRQAGLSVSGPDKALRVRSSRFLVTPMLSVLRLGMIVRSDMATAVILRWRIVLDAEHGI